MLNQCWWHFSSRAKLQLADTSTIHCKMAELVEEYSYLGILTVCSSSPPTLKKSWGDVSSSSVSWGRFSMTCWFYSITLYDRASLQCIVKVCSKIIGFPVRTLSTYSVQNPTEPLTCPVPSLWVVPLCVPNPVPTGAGHRGEEPLLFQWLFCSWTYSHYYPLNLCTKPNKGEPLVLQLSKYAAYHAANTHTHTHPTPPA